MCRQWEQRSVFCSRNGLREASVRGLKVNPIGVRCITDRSGGWNEILGTVLGFTAVLLLEALYVVFSFDIWNGFKVQHRNYV